MMNMLRTSLLANAVFSTLTAITLLLFSRQVAVLFGLSRTLIFLIIGAGLLVFAASVAIEAGRQRPGKVRLIIIQDAIWVLASVVVLIFRPFDISSVGYVLIGVVAALVGLFGLGQWLGLSQKADKIGQFRTKADS